jgi:hypothetical protein
VVRKIRRELETSKSVGTVWCRGKEYDLEAFVHDVTAADIDAAKLKAIASLSRLRNQHEARAIVRKALRPDPKVLCSSAFDVVTKFLKDRGGLRGIDDDGERALTIERLIWELNGTTDDPAFGKLARDKGRLRKLVKQIWGPPDTHRRTFRSERITALVVTFANAFGYGPGDAENIRDRLKEWRRSKKKCLAVG